MKREWRPGDVAVIEVGCSANTHRAVFAGDGWNYGKKWHWVSDEPAIVSVVRPLVVLDPEDTEQVERLLAAYRNAPAPEHMPADAIHASFWRSGSAGTLCRDGWEPRVTSVTDDVTCPLCRHKIDGGSFTSVDRMQAALREYADPKLPKPEEPTGLGAVVEDVDGVWWVRRSTHPARSWSADTGSFQRAADYDDIDAVRVLSEGVTEDGAR